ncbi:MAG: hypothetical protein OEU74_04340 [Gammaproteobacteria bacterium]|nr:hypothetical protein [Gammaproteobacteria bacterium]
MNKKVIVAGYLGALLIGGSLGANADDQGAGNHYVLNLVGTGAMYDGLVPDIDGDGHDDPAICFDVNLVDMLNQRNAGTATDCLSNVTPTGTGVALVGTTYFNLPQGELVVRGNTTVQPVFHPTVTPAEQTITHITGAASPDNAVISGTRNFAGAEGTVRLSGMVDMTNFNGNVGDPISFDCLFVVDLK